MPSKTKPPVGGGGRADVDGGRLSKSTAEHITATAPRQEAISLYAANGRVVAQVRRGVLEKQVDGSRHFLRKPAGIAFDDAILRQADELGAQQVRVRDRETGVVYLTTVDAFARLGVKVDRGFGVQVCLPFAYWQTQTPGAPQQLGLFAECRR